MAHLKPLFMSDECPGGVLELTCWSLPRWQTARVTMPRRGRIPYRMGLRCPRTSRPRSRRNPDLVPPASDCGVSLGRNPNPNCIRLQECAFRVDRVGVYTAEHAHRTALQQGTGCRATPRHTGLGSAGWMTVGLSGRRADAVQVTTAAERQTERAGHIACSFSFQSWG